MESECYLSMPWAMDFILDGNFQESTMVNTAKVYFLCPLGDTFNVNDIHSSLVLHILLVLVIPFKGLWKMCLTA